MKAFNIKTTLGICPTYENPYICSGPQLEHTVIVRGTSAALVFDFTDKFYSLEDLSQITFILKQDHIDSFKLFKYLRRTSDREVITGKAYYTDLKRLSSTSYECTAVLVTKPEGNPTTLGYYEEVEDNCSWEDTNYILNNKFKHEQGNGFESISLNFSPKDTLAFTADSGIQFEVIVKFNTTKIPGFGDEETVMAIPQPTITVLDSLYSKLQGE